MMGMMSGPGGEYGGHGQGWGMEKSWESPPNIQPQTTIQLQSFYGPPHGRGSPLGGGTLPAPQGANTFELIPHRVFVGGFPMGTTEAELREFFEAFGNVREVKLIKNPDGTARGYGFVTYSSESEAADMRQVQPDRLEFKGRKLNIGPAMRRINLTTRFSDLALAHPAAATAGHFPFQPHAIHMPNPYAPPPGYAASIPYNFMPQQVVQQAPPYAYWAPAPPNYTLQTASPPFYAQPHGVGNRGFNGRASPGPHRKRPRFVEEQRAARKAGGGGGGNVHMNNMNNNGHSTPARDNTPIPPHGHPLTPLTPSYNHQMSGANLTPPPGGIIYAQTHLNNYSNNPNEISPASDYPNYVG